MDTLVQAGKFRDDLYFRLNMLNLELPPLKLRQDDILTYAETFLREFAAESSRECRLAPEAAAGIKQYAWPGNIRELRNIMGRLAVTAETNRIDSASLQKALKPKGVQNALPAREERMIQEIYAALKEAKGNYTAAAKILGLHRMTLRRRMQKLNIEY